MIDTAYHPPHVEWRKYEQQPAPPEVQRLYDDGVAIESPMFVVEPRVLEPLRNNLYLKAEYLQPTIGSFKVGSYLDMLATVVEEPMGQYDFVAASAGNHAQGVAAGVQRLREQGYCASAEIYMPKDTPRVKIDAVRALGARTQLVNGTVQEALAVAKEQSGFFVHPYDSEGVITANGRVGYEIMTQLPEADIVFVPAGGGGLVAGVARTIKAHRPEIQVVAVQLEGADALVQSFHKGEIVSLPTVNGLSDGTAVKAPGELAMKYIWDNVDDAVTVSTVELGKALDYASGTYAGQEAVRLEPAGALALAAALKFEDEMPEASELNIVAVASGQNADAERVKRLRESYIRQSTEALGGIALRDLRVISRSLRSR